MSKIFTSEMARKIATPIRDKKKNATVKRIVAGILGDIENCAKNGKMWIYYPKALVQTWPLEYAFLDDIINTLKQLGYYASVNPYCVPSYYFQISWIGPYRPSALRNDFDAV